MAQAIEDLEAVRRALEIESWIVLGHSWGSDLAVRYALDHPARVRGVVGVAGRGLHRDREWSAVYEEGKAVAPQVDIDWVPEVHAALWVSFKDWIHGPTLWRDLADSPVPMRFIATGDDIRPSWPLQQLALAARVRHSFGTNSSLQPCNDGRTSSKAPPPLQAGPPVARPARLKC